MNNVKKLSDFIDCLNNEKKPSVKADSEELIRLYGAVRQIKSLKPPAMPDKDFSKRLARSLAGKKRPAKTRRRTWIAGMGGIAAILVITLLLNLANLTKSPNIVYAMEQVYNSMKAYHGTLEVIFSNEAGDTQIQSVLDVWVDKRGSYYIDVLEGSYKGLKTISDGEKIWLSSANENLLNVLPVFSETYEFIFELGNEIDGLKNAESAKIAGEEKIAGRPCYILEVTPEGGLTYKLWVDKETKLPLQKQGAMQKAIQYTTRYTEITFEDSIPEELMAIDTNAGFKEVDFDENKNTGIVDNSNIDGFAPEFTVEVDMEIEKAEQASADSGSSPWKLDPVYVAQVFVSLKISPEGIVGDYPVNYDDLVIAANDGVRAKIEVNSDKTDIKTVYLERLIRQDDTGIWTVTGYDMNK